MTIVWGDEGRARLADAVLSEVATEVEALVQVTETTLDPPTKAKLRLIAARLKGLKADLKRAAEK